MFSRLRILTLCTVALGLAPHVQADEIVLKDGRVVNGKILRENKEAGTVLFRTQSGSARAEFELKTANIKKLNYSELPEAFWDQAGPTKNSKAAKPYAGVGTPFLECPITGAFGKDVFAVGIEKTLRNAISKGVKEIVFTIDSEGSWNVDEVSKIVAVLKKYDDQLFYNVLIKKSIGESLAFSVFADDVFFAPGAILGGVQNDGKDVELTALNARIARKAYEIMQAKGQSGDLVRAMIDPQHQLSAWKNKEGGKLNLGTTIPASVAKEDVVFECKEGEVLVLQPAMLSAANITFVAKASEIGKIKEMSPWVALSDVGFTIMKNVRTRMGADLQKESTKTNKKVTTAVQRRDALLDEYDHYMTQAKNWDPTKQKYSNKGRTSSNGRRFGRGLGGSIVSRNNNNYDNYTESKNLTKDSRKRWKEHSKNTINYLQKAGKELSALRSAEKRVEKLGIERVYTDKQLTIAMEDTATKIRHLRVMFDRRSE